MCARRWFAIAAAVACAAVPILTLMTPAEARRLRAPVAVLRVVTAPLHVIASRVRSASRHRHFVAAARRRGSVEAGPESRVIAANIGRSVGTYWTYSLNELIGEVLQPADGKRYTRMTDVCNPLIAWGENTAPAKQDAAAAIDALVKILQPSDAQRARLDEFRSAWLAALDALAATCSAPDALAPPAQRLAATADYLSAVWRAAIHVHTPLKKFYASLTDEQKALLNGDAGGSPGDRVASAYRACIETARVIPNWPAGRIEQRLGATADQRAGLAALRAASGKMAEFVAASCPRTSPATPLGRLSAEENQLMTLIFAVQAINEPLARFYDSLSETQKSRFQASLQ